MSLAKKASNKGRILRINTYLGAKTPCYVLPARRIKLHPRMINSLGAKPWRKLMGSAGFLQTTAAQMEPIDFPNKWRSWPLSLLKME